MHRFLLLALVAYVDGYALAEEIEFDDTETLTYAGNYLVVAPKVVRPGMPYAVYVNILNSPDTEHIVHVEIRNNRNETIGARVVSGVHTGRPQVITIVELSA